MTLHRKLSKKQYLPNRTWADSTSTNWWDDGNLVSGLQDQELISKKHVLLPNGKNHLILDDSKPEGDWQEHK